MNDFYTYAYLRKDLSPYYVGKGRGNRMFSTNRHIAKPKDNHRIAMLRGNMSEDDALLHEIEMIKTWGRKDLGTGLLRNRTNGGDGLSGHKFSDESRAKLRIAQLGKKMSKEAKAKMSLAKQNTSNETKAKMSLAGMGNKNRLGKKHTNETKAKMSLAKKGKIISKGTRAKLSSALIAWWEVKKGMDRTND